MRRNILTYLEETAARLPDKTAFSDGTDCLTFSELLYASQSAGTYLGGIGVFGEPVLVLMDRHPKVICAFLGIIYAGAHYVCIDEKMPRARMELILESIRPRVIVTDKKNFPAAESLDVDKVLLFDEIVNTPQDKALLSGIRARQIDTDPIYIVFTSGSTGVPKGVAACHRSVIDYTDNLSLASGSVRRPSSAIRLSLFRRAA